ncbi:zinc transporter ZntB [Paraglaciecola sp. L3A3]|uniref:zinc transporter ZntB n=1 Tax=Paraglaciecola sp. L3A3 TaxID=2686358 RepID=UPI0018EED34A|nr:zinc transporter ZntB [Paraglaciecola sp. L3A3]
MNNPQHEALLWALNLSSNDPAKQLDMQSLLNISKEENFSWVHVQADAHDAEDCLSQLGVQNEIIDALCTTETRPKALQFGEGMLIYLRGINRNPNTDPEDMVSLRLWVTKNRLISARRKDRRLLSVQDVKDEIAQNIIPQSPMDLVVDIITKIANRISETVDELDEELTSFESDEGIEQQDRMKLSLVRRKSASLRRYLAPQRDALDAIYRFHKSLSQEQAFDLRDQTDRMSRYVEELDLARERAMVLQDELRNRIAELQGMRMYVLSLVTAIFLPLSFLTGVFGMNVAGLPGTEEPSSFINLVGGMIAVALIATVIMVWKKWL